MIVLPLKRGKYKVKYLLIVDKFTRFLMFFKASCQSLSKIWNTLRLTCYHDDLLILTNSIEQPQIPLTHSTNGSGETLNLWYDSA
jgi:hypothetical protein